jgi:HAD superfamily hydrolase (TIGR01549 family)
VIRSAIFDLGGTLVDYHASAADWRSMEGRGITALRHFLVERGHALPVAEPSQGKDPFGEAMWNAVDNGWREAMAGHANAYLPNLITETLACFGVTLDEETRWQATRVYARAVGEGAYPLDGAHEILSTLKERGLRLGLLSNTMWPGQFHREELASFGLIEFFDDLAFSCETGFWKPNVPAFRYMIDRLGVSPGEVVYVGDLPQVDVSGAQHAGLRAVWMATDGIELGDVRPDAIAHRLTELSAVLDQWGSH